MAVARTVPPLNSLHVFEVASSVGSFTEAAELLSVTPSAVSRQISALEGFLNVRLFNRGRDGNTLTPAGEEYCREIAPAFEAISAATDRISRRQDKTPLNVRVPSTFATRFLIPRLSQFRGEEPGISVRIVTGFGAVDFAREDVDVSIQAVSGDWPGAQCHPMFENWVQPVCGPQLLTTCMIREVDDLRSVRLLQSQNRRGDWREWLTAVGRPDFPLEQAEIVEFSNSLLAYQAAMDGLGVAIGHLPLLGPDLTARRLIALLDRPIRQGSYYAVWRTDRGRGRKARKFLAWLQRQLDTAATPTGTAAIVA
jgi:LysR family glycine cleavage system transcriptional activator